MLQVVPEQDQESLPASPVYKKGSLPNILEEEPRVKEELKDEVLFSIARRYRSDVGDSLIVSD